MFRVVNVYLDHLKFYGVCLECRRYVCCSECNIVSNKGNEPTPCLTQPIGGHGGEVMYFACFALWVNLVSLIVIISACVL